MNKSTQHNLHRVMTGGVLSAITGITVLTTGCASMPPPTEQMAVSKAAVVGATSAGGNEFAPVELASAVEKMSAAEKALADEDFERAKRMAEQAQVDATLAETRTALAKAQLAVNNAKESNRILREEINRASPGAKTPQ